MIHFLIHEKTDSVGVATVDLEVGSRASGLYMDSQDGMQIDVLENIPLGHKIALADLAMDDTVFKYGHDIGRSVATVKKGGHVHTHNLKTKRW